MLRGAIDYVSRKEIGGWIYVESGSVRDRNVLAFVDDVCVGAGRVELFRKDLVEAGLGDGFLGFRFTVNLTSDNDLERIAVKLEGSDALFIQPKVRLVSRASALPTSVMTVRTQTSIEWMRAKGWLEQAEYDFLRLMTRFGAYDFSLRKSKLDEKSSGIALSDPADAAGDLFQLLCLAQVTILVETLGRGKTLASFVDQLRSGLIEPVIALWSPHPGSIAMVEGSHLDKLPVDDISGAVEYQVGPDRLLFVDLRCRMDLLRSELVKIFTIAVG